MTRLEGWLAEYETSHVHPINRLIHKVAVPAITFCVLAALWHAKVAGVNLGVFAAAAYTVAVSLQNLRLGAFLGLELGAMLALASLLERSAGAHFWLVLGGLFVLSWVAQFIGHHIEGRQPAFLRNALFLLVGPLWTLRALAPLQPK